MDAPCTRAAMMCSELRIVRVSALAIRAKGDQVVSAIASTAFSNPGPSAETKASARISLGNARKMSVIRIRIASTQPPTYPATVPTRRPTGTTIMPTRATI